jgi:peroxiredoxin
MKQKIIMILATAWLSLGSQIAFAQNFKVVDLDGKTHQLSEYRGKWVVVNFWATWCAPCLAEMPDFEAAWQSRKQKDLVVLGVALDFDDAKEIREAVEKRRVHYPIILGDDKVVGTIVTGKEGVNNLPMTVIFGPDGKERYSGVGKLSREKLDALTR